jgi:GT2 family glycosyltransferase
VSVWLSVVMPTFNGARYVADALDSIVAQDDEDIEVIAVDDNSTDGTVEILERYASRLPLRIEHHARGNWAAGTNHGLERAQGAYVSFLHQDDYWLPSRLRTLRTVVDGSTEPPVLVLHPVYFVDASGRRVGTWNCPLPPDAPLDAEFVVERLLVQNFLSVTSAIFSRTEALRVGGLNDGLWHTADWDLWLKLASSGHSWYVPEPLAAYRVHGAALSMTRSAETSDLRAELESVLGPHLDAWMRSHVDTRQLEMVARFSVETNVMLAALAHGQGAGVGRWAANVLRLGPAGMRRYLRDSRVIERSLARLRARRHERAREQPGVS